MADNSNTFPQYPNRAKQGDYSPQEPSGTTIVSRGSVSHPKKPPRARPTPLGPGLRRVKGSIFVS